MIVVGIELGNRLGNGAWAEEGPTVHHLDLGFGNAGFPVAVVTASGSEKPLAGPQLARLPKCSAHYGIPDAMTGRGKRVGPFTARQALQHVVRAITEEIPEFIGEQGGALYVAVPGGVSVECQRHFGDAFREVGWDCRGTVSRSEALAAYAMLRPYCAGTGGSIVAVAYLERVPEDKLAVELGTWRAVTSPSKVTLERLRDLTTEVEADNLEAALERQVQKSGLAQTLSKARLVELGGDTQDVDTASEVLERLCPGARIGSATGGEAAVHPLSRVAQGVALLGQSRETGQPGYCVLRQGWLCVELTEGVVDHLVPVEEFLTEYRRPYRVVDWPENGQATLRLLHQTGAKSRPLATLALSGDGGSCDELLVCVRAEQMGECNVRAVDMADPERSWSQSFDLPELAERARLSAIVPIGVQLGYEGVAAVLVEEDSIKPVILGPDESGRDAALIPDAIAYDPTGLLPPMHGWEASVAAPGHTGQRVPIYQVVSVLQLGQPVELGEGRSVPAAQLAGMLISHVTERVRDDLNLAVGSRLGILGVSAPAQLWAQARDELDAALTTGGLSAAAQRLVVMPRPVALAASVYFTDPEDMAAARLSGPVGTWYLGPRDFEFGVVADTGAADGDAAERLSLEGTASLGTRGSMELRAALVPRVAESMVERLAHEHDGEVVDDDRLAVFARALVDGVVRRGEAQQPYTVVVRQRRGRERTVEGELSLTADVARGMLQSEIDRYADEVQEALSEAGTGADELSALLVAASDGLGIAEAVFHQVGFPVDIVHQIEEPVLAPSEGAGRIAAAVRSQQAGDQPA
jgi:hypothetical protein